MHLKNTVKSGFTALFLTILVTSIQTANGEVWLPDKEYRAYFDPQGIYTVAGLLKNKGDNSIVPIIHITVKDGSNTISKSHIVTITPPFTDMPFKMKIPDIKSKEAKLQEIQIESLKVKTEHIKYQVLYDDTLVLHPDGHITGRIKNTDNKTIPKVIVHAGIRGDNWEFLDAGHSEIINDFKPGQIRKFVIHPDPSIASQVEAYSCFPVSSVGEIPTLNMTATRNGEEYSFRYLIEAVFTNPKFSDDGYTLMMDGINSYPLEVNANFELPLLSEDEKFEVYFGNKKTESLQSKGEHDNWHVLFKVPPQSQLELKIKGIGKPTIHEETTETTLIESNSTTETKNIFQENKLIYAIVPFIAGIAGTGIFLYKRNQQKPGQ